MLIQLNMYLHKKIILVELTLEIFAEAARNGVV